MKTTDYFKNSVMVRRPYLKEEWLEYVLKNPFVLRSKPMGAFVTGRSFQN
jgi:hypothetical protein